MGNNFQSYTCEQWSNLGASYPLGDDRSTAIWGDFGNGTVPRNVIIDSEGVVRYSAIGYNETAITALLDDLLTVLDVDEQIQPETLHLLTNYPNPFNAGTQIEFKLPDAGQVSLSIFDSRGKLVRTLQQGYLQSGTYRADWDTRNDQGGELPSGVYFARLMGASSQLSHKLLLIK